MLLLCGNLRASILLEHDIFTGNLRQQVGICFQPQTLVSQRLVENLVDFLRMGVEEFADPERGMATHRGHVLAGKRGMRKRFLRLRPQPTDYGYSVVAKNHEAIVNVSYDARQFEFQNPIKAAITLDSVLARTSVLFKVVTPSYNNLVKIIPVRSQAR